MLPRFAQRSLKPARLWPSTLVNEKRRQRCASFSSAGALQLNVHDDDDDDHPERRHGTTDGTDRKETQPDMSQPRLHALRERLRRERNEPFVWKTQDNNVMDDSQQHLKRATTADSFPDPDVSLNVFDILAKLREYPRPEKVLSDRYDRDHSYLRISLAERCNLRCRYCMPPDGVPLQPEDNLLQHDEIIALASLFAKNGVDKIRLTGGEPLLRKDLVQIVSDLAKLDGIEQVGMTTNGVTLRRHLPVLVDAGLTHVNISLDTLREDRFLDLTRRPGLQKVWESIEAACSILPAGRVKINCVVMKGVNDDEIANFCKITRQLPVDVRFIEWMPFSDNGWSKGRFVSYDDMLSSVSDLGLQRAVDGPNDTTKWWRLDDTASGRIGFITSMSQHFCGTCNRLRLTSDGQIKACLFGATELSLRDALRSGVSNEDLERLIHYAVQRKKFALGGHGSAQGIADANDNRPMTLIGG